MVQVLYLGMGVKDRWSEDWWRLRKGAMAHLAADVWT
jgi:hypothetical protein